jgi:2-oxo-4-hydroxy-4-carboxy-5-ureidoimidazoline decarboxylase
VKQKFHVACVDASVYLKDVVQDDTIKKRFEMADLNRLTPEEFVQVIGPVFEHSPWIAGEAAAWRPFTTLLQLHSALCETVRTASEEKQLALIRAHPDLVGRAVLTAESQREQADAGLGQLSPEEIALFQRYNAAYRGKFGFPFVICARLNKKDAILAGFARRMPHSREEEVAAALEEIFKIAWLRLRDLVQF